MKPVRSFASDNNAGIHPEVLKAIAAANQGHVVGYGDDAFTESAIGKFKKHFGSDIEVFMVFNGTAANCLSLKALTDSYQAVICTAAAHIYTDECGAPEKFTGCKLIPIPTTDGKLTVDEVSHAYHGIGDQHHVQPRVISITQATEMGTVYQPGEIKALAGGRNYGLSQLNHVLARRQPTVVLLGVQPATTEWGTELSPAVGAVMGSLIEAAVAELIRVEAITSV